MSVTLNSDRIQDALYGFARSQLLFTAIDLDVFSAIAKGDDSLDVLADRLEVSHRGLRIFLDGLIGIGFLEKRDGRYRLPADVARYLVADSETYMGGMVTHCKGLYENWTLLTDVVRFGQPAGGAQSLAEVETYFAELVKGLYVSNYPTAQRLAKVLHPGVNAQELRFLDVAGGSAVWSIAMLERDPSCRATVLDYPTVIHVAEEYVEKHRLTDRYDYLPGDLEEMEFPHDAFDLAILGNICHALGGFATQKLFHNVFQALKPGGRIAIVDFVPDDDRAKPGWPLIFGVNMLISTLEGNVYTASQYRQWLNEAGFQSVTRHELESEVTVIIGQK